MSGGRSILNSILLDKSCDTSLYRQLVGQINCIIQTGQLVPGELLPTIRALAAGLAINPNTVARAYAELQTAGMITKRRGSGCSVATSVKRLDSAQKATLLADQIKQLILRSEELGVGVKELIRLIEAYSVAPVLRVEPSIPNSTASKSVPMNEPVVESPDIWQPDEEFID
jgi:GntR family transcriptional regulator